MQALDALDLPHTPLLADIQHLLLDVVNLVDVLLQRSVQLVDVRRQLHELVVLQVALLLAVVLLTLLGCLLFLPRAVLPTSLLLRLARLPWVGPLFTLLLLQLSDELLHRRLRPLLLQL